MALEINYHFKTQVRMTGTQTLLPVPIPQTVTPSKTWVIISISNLPNESTYGGSMGNVLVNPVLDGTGDFINLERSYNYQQAIDVNIDLIEYTALSGISVERVNVLLDSATQKNTAPLPINGWTAKTFALCYMKGNPPWNADMSEYCILAQEDSVPNNIAIFHKKVHISLIAHAQVVTVTDPALEVQENTVQAQLVNGIYNQLLQTSTPLNKTLNFASLYGFSFGVKNGRDFPSPLMTTPTNLKWECFNTVNNLDWYLQTNTLKVSDSTTVYRGETPVNVQTTQAPLPASLEILKSVAFVVGQYSSWGSPNTYEEESGDFAMRINLIDRGDGFADFIEIIRGQSISNPSAVCRWEVATYAGTQGTPKTDYYYKLNKKRKAIY